MITVFYNSSLGAYSFIGLKPSLVCVAVQCEALFGAFAYGAGQSEALV